MNGLQKLAWFFTKIGCDCLSGAYYYSRLSTEEKTAYNAILAGLDDCSSEITLPFFPSDGFKRTFSSVTLDNPLIFQADSYNQQVYGGIKCIIKPYYKFSRDTVKSYKNKTIESLRAFDRAKLWGDAEKELFVHDFMLKHFTYDYARGEHAHSVLGLVLYGKAVCDGIAKFVKLALNYLGVKCLVVMGDSVNPTSGATEPHAWNIVQLGGRAYHLDVTFDMSISSGSNRYDYFNLSDDDINKDHVLSNEMPACTTAGGDYYSLNKQVVGSPKELKGFIKERLRQGKRDIIFRINNLNTAQGITDRVARIASDAYRETVGGTVSIGLRFNETQMVYELSFR